MKSLDPVVLDPEMFEVRLENSRVRVLEVRMPRGSRHAPHSHPEHVIYAVSSYVVVDIFPDGTRSVSSREAGEVVWGEPGTHEAENVGESPAHALIIEIKK